MGYVCTNCCNFILDIQIGFQNHSCQSFFHIFDVYLHFPQPLGYCVFFPCSSSCICLLMMWSNKFCEGINFSLEYNLDTFVNFIWILSLKILFTCFFGALPLFYISAWNHPCDLSVIFVSLLCFHYVVCSTYFSFFPFSFLLLI